jgi:hypothetical protein
MTLDPRYTRVLCASDALATAKGGIIPKPARPRQMVYFVALLVVSGRSPRVDRTAANFGV